jgi:hypothetical protein
MTAYNTHHSCYNCGKTIYGTEIAAGGNYFHPECSSGLIQIQTIGCGTNYIMSQPTPWPINASLTQTPILSQTEIEKLIQDALWKNKTRFGK